MRRYHRNTKPTKRTITVKYAGACACCGGTINAGDIADYFPAGSLSGRTVAAIAHPGGLDGTSAKCTGVIERSLVNDYAGDGLDQRYEDQCADQCR